jgi:hypothetical protein
MKLHSQNDSYLCRLEPGVGRTSALRDFIGARVAEQCLQVFGVSLKALILTGSLARDEATLLPEEYGWRFLGDAEFLLIFRDRAPLPNKLNTRALQEDIEASLFQAGISGQVNLSSAHAAYLRRLRPDIFAYELRHCGQVIWGDGKILEDIPRFLSADIPFEDGWRLLSNRMLEHLETFEEVWPKPKVLSHQVFYRTVKLYLDMATSLLVFTGNYAPTYAERAQCLATLAGEPCNSAKMPFDLHRFSQHVMECMEWKTSASKRSRSLSSCFVSEHGFVWWEEAVGYAENLWRWELEQLTHQGGHVAARELLECWMRRQRFSRRLKGWLFVARDQGWLRSWKQWPRWALLAWRASPRYWVYGVAHEMFTGGSRRLKHGPAFADGDINWEELRSSLPVTLPVLPGWHELSDWSRLSKEVAWNYEQFLTTTRA